MKKELLVVFLLLALPVFFVLMMEGFSSTGAIVNDFAVLRKDRVELYLNFPSPADAFHAGLARNVKDYLRAGAHEDFYGPDHLKFGDRFFENEQNLVELLLKLSCLRPVVSPPKGLFVTGGGMDVVMLGNKFFYTPYDDFMIPCSEQVRPSAEMTLKSVLVLDVELVRASIEFSNCPELAKDSFDLSLNALQRRDLEGVLTYLRVAWDKADKCS